MEVFVNTGTFINVCVKSSFPYAFILVHRVIFMDTDEYISQFY